MLQLLTTIRMHLPHVCSIKKFRIRCIMQCMGIQQQNLLLKEPMQRKNTWD